MLKKVLPASLAAIVGFTSGYLTSSYRNENPVKHIKIDEYRGVAKENNPKLQNRLLLRSMHVPGYYLSFKRATGGVIAAYDSNGDGLLDEAIWFKKINENVEIDSEKSLPALLKKTQKEDMEYMLAPHHQSVDSPLFFRLDDSFSESLRSRNTRRMTVEEQIEFQKEYEKAESLGIWIEIEPLNH